MNTHHHINYVEFPATDVEATKAFYGKTFGWTFTDYGPEYVAFASAGVDGGFTTKATVAPGALIVLYSNNLEATKTAVEANGGKIVKDIFPFPGGRRFHFTDPNGNELAVWSE